ncbi:MAG: NAD+ synthase [Bacteroidia bacterium]|nr:NAD+ synthase [Bacteroidia bacterium]
MKIALAQLNFRIADIYGNTTAIIASIHKAKAAGADLVVFSELSVTGYPPLDLLEQKDFINETEKAINIIAVECIGIAALIGAPSLNRSTQGKKLFNSAFFLCQGKIHHIQHKTHLPNYDVFDEYRYFEHNTVFEPVIFLGKKIALTICEDLWDDQPPENSFAREKLYIVSPMDKLAVHKPDLIINISASPFSYNKDNLRKEVLVKNASSYHIPVIYLNQVGANTDLVFDGGSMVLNSNGEIVTVLNFFEEDFRIIETDEIDRLKPVENVEWPVIRKIHNALVLGIRDYFGKMGFRSAILGLSGGIDSAVTLVLAVRALGASNVRVLLMPSVYSSDHSVKDAVALADHLGVSYDIVNIQPVCDSFRDLLQDIFGKLPADITEENIQARARGVFLMAVSNKYGNILLNTSNKSEAAVGYGTLYGDMNGGLSVLGDVYKTDVYRLAEFINAEEVIIPVNTIIKPPSAELRPDQKDSDSLPEYELLDKILFQYIELKQSASEITKSGYNPELVTKIIHMVNSNEYKRFQCPPILRVSSKSFGFGRRMPLVAKY